MKNEINEVSQELKIILKKYFSKSIANIIHME